MHKIEADHLDSGAIAFKASLLLNDMDTRLISILVDTSGGASLPQTRKIIEGIKQALDMCAKGATINLIQFDTQVVEAFSMSQAAMQSYDYVQNKMGGGGTLLGPALKELSTQTPSKHNFRRRTGDFQNTPVLIISDGYWEPGIKLGDDTILFEYGLA